MRSLLDVNVLVALLDEDHVHHQRATEWLGENERGGWASCPITQNGCIRIMSQPAYPKPLPAQAVIERLAAAVRDPSHEFWRDDLSLLDPAIADPARIHGPKQVTDLYLLALAVENDGRLATFDDAIPISAIRRATRKNIVVI